ncbi:hypothetical protein KHP62_11725 [Rhodobacteraceae bacterium NNCM2]|nr:hypothetical protein [Coraliihabitans acroporae]
MARIDDIAWEIINQHRERRTFRNLSGDFAPRDIDEAYQVQAALHDAHLNDGRGRLAGRKIALASAVQQQLCGVDHPIAGGIFASEIVESPAEIRASSYHGLGIEFELAIEIGREISRPGLDRESIRAHIASIRPAFELIVDRGADYSSLDAKTMIADNAWGAGVVLGEPIPDWQDRDIDAMPCELEWTGEAKATALAGDADPLGSLAWVANLVAEQGHRIEGGDIVITGSVIKTRYPTGGEAATYTIDGCPVELRIV